MIIEAVAVDGSELVWFKSSYSSSEASSDCVEVATSPGAVHIRDSKDSRGPVLGLSPDAWSSFVAYATA